MKNLKSVYTHTSNKTNKVIYVGAGTSTRPYDFTKWGRSKKHYEVIQNEGVTVEIIQENLTIEQAAKLEIKLIKKYGINNLFNKRISGSGTQKMSDATKAKLSKAQKGVKKHSEEFKQKMRELHTGRVISKEHRAKLQASKFKRKVIDRSTGIIYKSVKEAAANLDVKYTTLIAQLRGRGKATTLRYV